MNISELIKREFYIIDCMDFTYFARPVHVVGIDTCAYEEEIQYMIDVKDSLNPNEYRTMYMYELERFKTMEETEQEAKRLNNIPSNKKEQKNGTQKESLCVK